MSGDVKVNATIVDQIIDLELNQDAKAKVTASFPSVIPNGKPPSAARCKTSSRSRCPLVRARSVSRLTSPTTRRRGLMRACATRSAVASPSGPWPRSRARRWRRRRRAIQARRRTYALTAADQFKTFKVSAVTALDNKQTIGAEVTYKKTATATIGYSKKMDGHSFKAVVSNPVAAEVNPTLCVNASLGSLIPKTTATLSAQVDKTVRTQTKRNSNARVSSRLVSSRPGGSCQTIGAPILVG